MIIERTKYRQFLKEELQKQTDDFKQKLDSSAIDLLLDKNEMFVAIFIKFDNGEMILKFSTNRPLPRKNDFLYCFTLPETLRRYKDWGNRTYGDLIKCQTQATEVKCIWHSKSNNPKFLLAGFRGVSEEFKKYVEKAPGGVITLGPKVPPFEYLANLEKITHSFHHKCNQILDAEYSTLTWAPILLDSSCVLHDRILNDYSNSDVVILQGPPGTGKTTRIASLCEFLCKQNKSVLVTALTNRALIEVAGKLTQSPLMTTGKIYKTNLSTDEVREYPKIQSAEKVHAIPGALMLSTFYISSGAAANNYEEPLFDYVIVDEASQAFLPMLAAANMLGCKNLWVGDVHQMPPIAELPKDRISKMGYAPIVDGFDTITASDRYMTYQLSDSFRLGERAVRFTGIFYNNSLVSKSKLNGLFKTVDGPILMSMKMPKGDPKPLCALEKAISLASDLMSKTPKLRIAILSHLTKTTQALQMEVAKQIGISKNILVDTVARVQGLTTDVTIYVIPDTDAKLYSLELRLFNVATSRAEQNTYIICPDNILSFSYMSTEVRKYLSQLI